jgi:multidrug efflux system outer membrane protein
VTAESDRKSEISSVKQAYYTVLADQRQLDILRQTLSQRQTEQERTQTLFSRHDATLIDQQQADINLTTAELDLDQGGNTLEVDRDKLSDLIGWPAGKVYTVAEVEDLEVPSLEVAEAVQKALQQRADLSQLQLSRSSGDITLALRRSQFAPTIAATGGLSWRQDWSSYPFQALANWNAGLQVNVPLLDAGYSEQQVREAELQNRAYDIQAGQLAASIATDVKSALFNLRNLLARVKLAESSLRLSEANYELYLTQFEQGVSTNLDLLTASVGLTTARVNLAKARSDAQLGILTLQTAMGE